MSDIIETLRSIQCSDVACGNLRVAMGLKLAIYEIERLCGERDSARREVLMWLKERCSNKELKEEVKNRGWEYLYEDMKHRQEALDRIVEIDEELGLL